MRSAAVKFSWSAELTELELELELERELTELGAAGAAGRDDVVETVLLLRARWHK